MIVDRGLSWHHRLKFTTLERGARRHICILGGGGASATATNYADPKLVWGFRSISSWYRGNRLQKPHRCSPHSREKRLLIQLDLEEAVGNLHSFQVAVVQIWCLLKFVIKSSNQINKERKKVIVDGTRSRFGQSRGNTQRFADERTNVTMTILILFSLRMTIKRKYFKTANGSQTGPHWWGHGVAKCQNVMENRKSGGKKSERSIWIIHDLFFVLLNSSPASGWRF